MNRLEQLLQFEKENPTDSFIQYCLALEYIKSGDHEKALAGFRGLIQRDENYVATYYHLGKLCEQLGEKTEAEATYTHGLQIARKINDHHAYSELLNAKNELVNNYDIEFDN